MLRTSTSNPTSIENIPQPIDAHSLCFPKSSGLSSVNKIEKKKKHVRFYVDDDTVASIIVYPTYPDKWDLGARPLLSRRRKTQWWRWRKSKTGTVRELRGHRHAGPLPLLCRWNSGPDDRTSVNPVDYKWLTAFPCRWYALTPSGKHTNRPPVTRDSALDVLHNKQQSLRSVHTQPNRFLTWVCCLFVSILLCSDS